MRAIFKKTKKVRIRNTNISLELGEDKIRNDIQKSRSRWFDSVMCIGKERIPKKMLHTKVEGKRPRGRPKSRWIDHIRKYTEMKGEKLGRNTKNRKWESTEGWRFLCYS